MVKLKTKSDKHINDNEKRRKSIKEKEKAKLNQSQIIKQALSTGNLHNNSSKKIIFDDEDDVNNGESETHSNGEEKSIKGNGLFNGSSSEDENFEIKEKVQFSSKKGFELLNLQSTYGNDKRFQIDERFLEDEKEESEAGEDELENDGAEEKSKSLKILESVLGKPVTVPESERKAKKRTFEMIRYDATNKDHEKYEVKPESDSMPLTKKKKERRKSEKSYVEQPVKVQVSKEKFYEVSKEIKNSFKEKKDDGGHFSLLQTYGNDSVQTDDVDEDEPVNSFHGEEESEVNDFVVPEDKFPYEKDKKIKDKPVEKPKPENKGALVKGIWKESFFFLPDDPRFKEGLEFINKKNSKEASEAIESYDQNRRKLKEILRLHMKKQMHKKDPFRNKVGGMNKKQLANSKFKNFKSNFSKRKTHKMKPGGKV